MKTIATIKREIKNQLSILVKKHPTKTLRVLILTQNEAYNAVQAIAEWPAERIFTEKGNLRQFARLFLMEQVNTDYLFEIEVLNY